MKTAPEIVADVRTASEPQVRSSELVRRLVEYIHSDGKEHPYESGQLARLVGRSINSNPWVEGNGFHDAFRAGWQKPPNDPSSVTGAGRKCES